MEISLSLKDVSFSYKDTTLPVIDKFSLDVEKGSFTTLLGASGSGKTTILRLISGFLNPSAGEIKINQTLVNGVAPENRKIGMVFQDYALFPHLTVEQNLMYGLKLKNASMEKSCKMTKENLFQRITETAKTLEIEQLLKRYPNELSGGQQQRVALGRALVLEPSILLMDEPLSSLDTKLRQAVRKELKDIQKRLGITTIYVTHDHEEALFLSDKIAVLNQGRILQYGTGREIYFEPADCYTAEYVGNANFIQMENTKYLVRPEWIRLEQFNSTQDLIEGKIISSVFLGSKIRYEIETEYGKVNVDSAIAVENEFEPGKQVYMKLVHKRIINC